MKLEEINHTSVKIEGGGEVIILNTGAVINPESEAMLQALHSRSIGGLRGHLNILAKRGSENFMKNFYVGYGHKSIGDCGSISIFVEGISILVAKAIQDWPLYSGQEASTRYIDFKIQPFKNPLGTKEGELILETSRTFYQDSMEPTIEHLKSQFPIQEGESQNTYEKAINARAFDALRGFLPAGATTNLAWHTNLRQAADKIMLLRHHPLKEARAVADTIEKALIEAFPNSFGHERFEKTEKYNENWMKNEYYFHNPNCREYKITQNNIDTTLLPKEILSSRPPKTELPRHLGEAGTIQFEFTLDFGSFRDLQRHRAVLQRMPLVTTDLGFEDWYLTEVPEKVKEKAILFLKEQKEKIEKLQVTIEEKQYYIAMGYKTSNRLTGSLPAILYLVELRATRFVHPTLRSLAKKMAQSLKDLFGSDGLVVHLDQEPDRFDIKRGEHDIVLK